MNIIIIYVHGSMWKADGGESFYYVMPWLIVGFAPILTSHLNKQRSRLPVWLTKKSYKKQLGGAKFNLFGIQQHLVTISAKKVSLLL